MKLAKEGNRGVFGPTIQGEVAPPFGNLTWFIRLYGCGLTCKWCDTKHALKGHCHERTCEDIARQINKKKTNIVTISGGEPLEQDITALVALLRVEGYRVCLESAGYKFIELPFDWVVLSPKLKSSSGEGNDRHHFKRYNMGSFLKWRDHYAGRLKFKFVIETGEDIDEIMEYFVEPLEISKRDIYLMPRAATRQELMKNQEWAAHQAIKHGFNYATRLQVSLWDSERGK